ncbi:hypothetical protein HGA64_02745 [Candidatus Falkowbacteria bacterium]|nr:hypothetical protein [Candidatus Falkowbacteria bacterium]
MRECDALRINEETGLPEICKKVRVTVRGWFESLHFWPKTVEMEVFARQVPCNELKNVFVPMVLAEVMIMKENAILLKEVIPFPMFIGFEMLLAHVFIFSQDPSYEPKSHLKVLELFCRSFKQFVPVIVNSEVIIIEG